MIVGESRPPTGRCLCFTVSAASRLSGVELPPVFCPFESAIRPRVRQVERRAVEWIRDSGMCASERERARAVATHSTDFVTRFAPVADDDRLGGGPCRRRPAPSR